MPGPYPVTGAFYPGKAALSGIRNGASSCNVYVNAALTALYVPGMVEWNGDSSGTDVQDGSPSSMGVFKSTDNGVTWAEMDGGNRPQLARLDDTVAGGVCEGRLYASAKHPTLDKLYVVYMGVGNSYSGPMTASVFDMATDTWEVPVVSAITLYCAADVLSPGNLYRMDYYEPLCCFNTATDTLVVIYQQPQSVFCAVNPINGLAIIYRTTFDGMVWGANMVMPGQTSGFYNSGAQDNSHSLALTGGNGGRVHLLVSIQSIIAIDAFFVPGDVAGWDRSSHWLADDGADNTGVALELLFQSTPFIGAPLPGIPLGGMLQFTFTASTNQLVALANDPFFASTFIQYATEAASMPTGAWSTSASLAVEWSYSNTEDGGVSVFVESDGNFPGLVSTRVWNGLTFDPSVPWFIDNVNFAIAYIASAPVSSIGIAFSTSPVVVPIPPGPGVGSSFVGMYAGAGSPDIQITGAAPFGGPQVFTPGKVSLVGPPTGVGGGQIPGGWPVWPPIWQAENEYDRCLNRFRLRARNVCLADQSRCIVWHDMDELGRMPDGAVEFYERGSIITPAPAPIATTVLQFVVPTGYLGIVYGIVLHYTGTGFEEGSGDIVWRVVVGNAWAAPGLGNCLFSLGTVGQCLSLTDYIAANSNQRISVGVQVPNTSGNIQVGASRILATLQGWYYPI